MTQRKDLELNTPSFQEDHISQIPALQLLQNLGYQYLTPEEIYEERKGKLKNVLLEDVLTAQLNKINSIKYRGETFKFSPVNIYHATQALKNVQFSGLVQTNEEVYDLLILGKSFEETIHGNTRSYTLNYIDWENWDNNVFHVTEEFPVERTGSHETRRPDIILFINGIPFAVIECKRPDLKDDPIEQAISQQLRNQHKDEIPQLFYPVQVLVAVSTNDAAYGTVGTPENFWSRWREKNLNVEELRTLVNKPLTEDQNDKLFKGRFNYVREYFDTLGEEPRDITEQDKLLYSVLRPERLMDLTYRFIVYEAGEKKIARYQQYFAVRNILERISKFDEEDRRKGGVIWHTQGSGKSLTMVMMAKAIALEESITDPKIVIVTDRVELDDQISRTFKHCGKEPSQARTGKHLIKLIEGHKEAIVTTIINKFMAAIKRRGFRNDDANIFVLVDEAHRTEYGTMHAIMRKVLPRACYLGFTGTPIAKRDRNTYAQFGGIIDKYTIDQAIADKAVVPLLYEGRYVPQYVSQEEIDSWFYRVSEPLSDSQRADLKRKFSTTGQLSKADQRIHMIAWDISKHFQQTFQGTLYKGQLATPSKAVAIRYKKYFDEIGIVSTEVLISPPDDREGYTEAYGETTDEIKRFWEKMMEKYGNPETYDRELRNSFKKLEEPEIIVVVEKLLTGFDVPRNTVLYIDRELTEHTLLQAIARVNRLCKGKDFGFVIDYYGILENLDKALTEYRALADFDEEDLVGTLKNIKEEVAKLPQKHSDLHAIFKTIENKFDVEAYERLLADESIRNDFYNNLASYSRTLQVALSSVQFIMGTSDDKINRYKQDLKFFMNLRSSVRRRYAEVVDFKEYESRIKKLIDTYVSSDEVEVLSNVVPIFDHERFDAEIAKIIGEDAKADTIAYRTKRDLDGIKLEDPYFYKKFSKLLQEVIDNYRQQRITASQYLQQAIEIMDKVVHRRDEETPDELKHRDVARAFYGVTNDVFSKYDSNELKEIAVIAAIELDKIIRKKKIVDWAFNIDVQNLMKNDMEDYLFNVSEECGFELQFDDIDIILEKVLEIAKHHYTD